MAHANAQRFRELLRSHGFRFCDDQELRARELRLLYEPLEQAWRREAQASSSLIHQPVVASSTDHETQSIDNTLEDNRSFWSSGPSVTRSATESLVYQLTAPLCVVRFVYVEVYREAHQAGAPLYPPIEVSFGIGTTPGNISTVTPRYPVPLDDGLHPYPIPASAAPGMFLRVEFHGKQQLQREDMQYYIAIRYVKAVGEELPTAEAVAAVKQLLSTRQHTLPLLQGPRLADVQQELDRGAMLAAAQQDEQPGSRVFCHESSSMASTSQAPSSLPFLQRLRGFLGSTPSLPSTSTPVASPSTSSAGTSRITTASSQPPQTSPAADTGCVGNDAVLATGKGRDGGPQLAMTGAGMVMHWGLHLPGTACAWEVDKGFDTWQFDEDWDGLLSC